MRPRVPSHFHVSVEAGALVFRSQRRKITLDGRHFQEFVDSLLPLLDGSNTVAQIHEKVASIFTPASVDAALALLAENRLLEDGAPSAQIAQHNFLFEAGAPPDADARLAAATVAIIGSSEVAKYASGIGHVRIADSENDIDGAQFVVCCPDHGRASLLYRVNRACHKARIPWTSASVSGFEAILGPTVIPGATPCYLCYKMRSIACADNPGEEFELERSPAAIKDRENTAFASGAAGHLLGLEAMKFLAGLAPSMLGSIAVLDFLSMTLTRHKVLRKPACPICYGQ